MSAPRYPALFQINTRVRLSELGTVLGRPATLDDIPDGELDQLARDGFDLVWFLGVWQTGEAGAPSIGVEPGVAGRVSSHPPELTGTDISGSRFAVRDYHVHADFGGDEALARLRERLRTARPEARSWTSSPTTWRPTTAGSGSIRTSSSRGPRRISPPQPQNYRRVETTAGSRYPRLRPGPVLRRLARHAAAELREPGAAGGHARRAAANCRPVRRRPLRHGDAGAARGVRADLGHCRGAVLAAGDGGRPRRGPRLPVHGRGLLGPGVDAAAAGLRLHLRQAALRPARATASAAGPRALRAGPRLPGPPRALPREPRRAAGRGDLPAGRPPGGGRHHLPQPGLRFFHQGQREGKRVRISDAPRPRAGRSRRTRRSARSTTACWPA